MKPFSCLLAALLLATQAPSALALPSPDRAKELAARYYPSYVADLATLTNIDSGTGDAEGSRRIAAFLKDRLEHLGASVEFRSDSRATHVIGRFRGTGKLRLLLMAHTDTVFVHGDVAKRPFRVDAQRHAYGPGVGDDKATAVQCLYAMQMLKDLDFRDYREVVLYFDGEEETGSDLGKATIEELAKQSDAALVMDTARLHWGIVTWRKGRATYDFEVTGLSGHAGNAAHHSASATMELGHQLVELYKLASPLPADPSLYSRETLEKQGIPDHGQFIPPNTINVGVVSTVNTKVNIIPDEASAKLELRCFQDSELHRLDAAIRGLAGKTLVPGTHVTVTGHITEAPMEKTPQVQKMVDIYRRVVKDAYGAEIVEWLGGGLSDGNISAPFAPTLDGLGIENYDEHTDREWVDLNTVEPRTVALARFIRELAGVRLK